MKNTCWVNCIGFLGFLFIADAWGQHENKQALTFEWIYKQNGITHPTIDPDLPRQIKWAKDGHRLAYLVTSASAPHFPKDRPSSLVIYNPIKNASEFVLAPSALQKAIEALQSSTDGVPIAHTANLKPRVESATGRPKIQHFAWEEGDRVLRLHINDQDYRWDRSQNRLTHFEETPPPKLPEGEKRELSYSENRRYAAYVRGSNLWVYDTWQNREIQLTRDGGGTLLNGIYSWVYWEEIRHRAGYRAFKWSPDNRQIAYLQTDESGVSTYPVTNYTNPVPETEHRVYPKAGTKNPGVRLGVVALSNQQTVWIDLGEPFEYIVNFTWTPDGSRLAIEAMNRKQTRLVLFLANPKTGESQKVLEETRDSWAASYGGPRYLKKSHDFLWISDRSGYPHLYRYSRDGETVKALTEGEWGIRSDLNDIWIDENEKHAVFASNHPSPLGRQFYRVSLNGGKIERLTKEAGSHSLEFSADGRFGLNTFSRSDIPKKIQVIDHQGDIAGVLGETRIEDYSPLDLRLPKLAALEGPEGNTFYASITKPADFDASKKHPAIVHVYGGPAGQIVHNRFSRNGVYQAGAFAEAGFVYIEFDPRGTPNRGRQWLDAAHRNFGGAPVEDLKILVDYLKTLPYIDTERLGIWGWSQGGYMACSAMLLTPGVFQAGAAVAPVTDWRLYDTIYTERYMGHPDDNSSGYHDASPVNFAENLEGGLFLAHGVMDDNVHIQNIYRLVDALVEAQKDYRLYVFPERGHGIGGNTRRYHLFKNMVTFFKEHLIE